ncbi:MAG: mercury(II) reductase [Alphaproteobacteria bacterium]
MTATEQVDRQASARHNRAAADLIVVGAGSAGFSAAITAAELGAKVALIGHGTIGGTCVNVGCVPSKTLIRAVETVHQARSAYRFAGIEAHGCLGDWAALAQQKDGLVAELRQTKYLDLLPQYEGVTYTDGPARLVEGGVRIHGDLLSSDRVIIATGAQPALPEIPGIETVPYLTSTSALALEKLPRSLLVIGGGYIGCELAQMFSRAGVAVTLVFRSRLLPEAEPEISDALTGYLRDDGMQIRDGLSYQAITNTGHGVALEVVDDDVTDTIEADAVLVATGRRPNTDGLGLGEAGIDLSPGGAVQVDDRQRTTRTGVYAAGDVTGRNMFVYMAAHSARIAAENALNGDNRRYDASVIPAVVFTDPQVASCGLTEASARSQGMEIRTSVLPLSYVPRAIAARDTRGLIKLIAEARTGRLVGAHILAPEGADSIQTAVLAIKHGLTATELAETIFPYLTTVEGLKLAAQTFDKDVSKLSCCA